MKVALAAALALGLARLIFLLTLMALGLSVGGCGRDQATPVPNFRSIEGTEEQEDHAITTLDVFRNLVDVDASRIDLAFVTTWEEQRDACGGFAACTSPQVNGYLVTTFWPPDGGVVFAYRLAHELCHVYYLEVGEGGDATHSHGECFGRPDVGGQGAYGGGEGYAWQAAQDVVHGG